MAVTCDEARGRRGRAIVCDEDDEVAGAKDWVLPVGGGGLGLGLCLGGGRGGNMAGKGVKGGLASEGDVGEGGLQGAEGGGGEGMVREGDLLDECAEVGPLGDDGPRERDKRGSRVEEGQRGGGPRDEGVAVGVEGESLEEHSRIEGDALADDGEVLAACGTKRDGRDGAPRGKAGEAARGQLAIVRVVDADDGSAQQAARTANARASWSASRFSNGRGTRRQTPS